MNGEPPPGQRLAPVKSKRRVAHRMFSSTMSSWESLFDQAASFASEIGPERLINISHSEDSNEGVVVVWYWKD
jgi:hypothetical protein